VQVETCTDVSLLRSDRMAPFLIRAIKSFRELHIQTM